MTEFQLEQRKAERDQFLKNRLRDLEHAKDGGKNETKPESYEWSDRKATIDRLASEGWELEFLSEYAVLSPNGPSLTTGIFKRQKS